jgi:hypothetical protein
MQIRKHDTIIVCFINIELIFVELIFQLYWINYFAIHLVQ